MLLTKGIADNNRLEPRQGFNINSPGRQPGVDNVPHIQNPKGVQHHIDWDVKQPFILIIMSYSSTPSGLEFSLPHNPELALGAIHIQALQACVDRLFLSGRKALF